MNNLQLRALLAGLAWGIWPLILNRSGLNGNISAAVYSTIELLVLLPFAIVALGNNDGLLAIKTSWTMVVIAAALGACGLLLFNGMLAKASPQSVGTLCVIMILAQISVPALYQIIMNGGRLTVARAIGFAAAFVAALLLAR